MLSAKNDFQARSAEVETYFDFVHDIVEGRRALNPPMEGESFERFKKTIKANGFLLLYNLVESTVGNAIEAIFDELKLKCVRFDDCRIELQQVILGNLRKHNVQKIRPRLIDLSLHVVTETFRKRELFSGNVDARKVRETAEQFGFAAPANGHRLVVVKNCRNNLAHGEKSFAEVGRDCTVIELREVKENVFQFLASMLEAIETYLVQEMYLSDPPAVAAS